MIFLVLSTTLYFTLLSDTVTNTYQDTTIQELQYNIAGLQGPARTTFFPILLTSNTGLKR